MKIFACSSESANVLKLAALGTTLTVLAAVIILCDPLKLIVDSQLELRSGSLLYNIWLKPPMEVLIKVYMFNITNLEEFVRGIDSKLKVSEVGPYVYQEMLTHNNVTFNDNGTVTYTPRREVIFIREKSIGDPKVDRIIAPNIPYMGATAAASEISTLAAMGVSVLTSQLKSKPMLMMSVHEYLWGYEDNLVELASKIVPSFIDFRRFGILERMFDEGDNVVTMKLPPKVRNEKEDLRDFAVESWNGVRTIRFWSKNNEKITNCNSIRGAYDGTLFPRNIKKGETFRVYRKSFCRSLPIIYSHPGSFNGIEAAYFKLDEKAFDSDLQDSNSSCFCTRRKCLKKGLGNIKPCYYSIPLAISFPHFFNGDPSLVNGVDGLNPTEEKHGSLIIMQPQLGIPMKVHSRFQVNLLVDEVKFNRDMSKFRNTVLPILWLQIGIEDLTPELKFLLKLLFQICPYVQRGIFIALIVAGLTLVGASLFQCVSMPPATAMPTTAGILIMPAACTTTDTNGSTVASKRLQKVHKETTKTTIAMTAALRREPPSCKGNKTNGYIAPLLAPQPPQLEQHYREQEQQQLLQEDSTTLLLPEFMT